MLFSVSGGLGRQEEMEVWGDGDGKALFCRCFLTVITQDVWQKLIYISFGKEAG